MGAVPSYRDPLADVYICPVNGHLAWFTRPAVLDEVERSAPERRTPHVPRPCPEHPEELLITLAEDDMTALRRVAVAIEDGRRRVFVTEEDQGWMAVIVSPDAVSSRGRGETPAAAVAAAAAE